MIIVGFYICIFDRIKKFLWISIYVEVRSLWVNEYIDNDEEIKDWEDYVYIGW